MDNKKKNLKFLKLVEDKCLVSTAGIAKITGRSVRTVHGWRMGRPIGKSSLLKLKRALRDFGVIDVNEIL